MLVRDGKKGKMPEGNFTKGEQHSDVFLPADVILRRATASPWFRMTSVACVTIDTMIPALETSRLVLRPLELADAAQTQQLFPHWEIVKYLATVVPWPYPADGAHTYYSQVALPAMARYEQWHWSLRLKEAPTQLIGCVSLMKGENNRGFWMGLPWQGLGLMTEAVGAATRFWFEELSMPVLRVPKAAINLPSRRISEKQGMRVIRTEEKDYVGGRFLTEIWEMTAEEWRARALAPGKRQLVP